VNLNLIETKIHLNVIVKMVIMKILNKIKKIVFNVTINVYGVAKIQIIVLLVQLIHLEIYQIIVIVKKVILKI
jgi:hypothetical protein